MSLSNWTNERNVLLKVKQQPHTTATITVAKTAARDMGKLTLDRLNHADVSEVVIHLKNGSRVVVRADDPSLMHRRAR
jgi:hypothetical protein